MIYKIFENDIEVNRIVADETFVTEYCAENGYTYELEPPIPKPEPAIIDEYTDTDVLNALLGVNE